MNYEQKRFERLGFAFRDSNEPSGQQTVVQSNAPPSYAQPFLTDVLTQAQQQFNTNKSLPMYPNSTVVPFSNQTQAALQGIEQRATQGSPLVSGAQDQLQKTISGDYLNGNPNFNQMAQRVLSETLPAIQGGFNAAGRTGSGLANRAAALGGADAVGALAYKDYAQERQNMLNATQLAPTLAAQDYTDLSQLANVGASREQMAANQLQEEINRYYYPSQQQQQALGNYAALVGGGTVGSTGTSTRPIYSNPTANLLGTTLGAAGLANSLFSQGGGKGLLSGLFGS